MSLKESLLQYRSLNPSESNATDRFIEFLDSKENHFDRSNLKRHFTASAWLLSPSHREVLLTHHSKLNKWVQLGGHCDGSSDVLASALREAEEESGILEIHVLSQDIFDLDCHLIPARTTEPEHFHYDIRFLFQAKSTDFIVSEESHSLKWWAIEDEFFQKEAEPSLKQMHAKWLSWLQSNPLRE